MPSRTLEAGRLYIWRIALDPPDGGEQAAAILSAEERARADRFRFARHRRRFLVRRAAYRQILAQFLDRPANTLRFEEGEYGKPSLAPEDGGQSIAFNASHSEDIALFAAARQSVTLGVDIERCKPDAIDAALLARVLTKSESKAYANLNAAQQTEMFYRTWCRKEAFVKAEGVGLSFDVQTLETGAPRFGAFDLASPVSDMCWRLQDLSIPDYSACVAFSNPELRLEINDWTSANGT